MTHSSLLHVIANRSTSTAKGANHKHGEVHCPYKLWWGTTAAQTGLAHLLLDTRACLPHSQPSNLLTSQSQQSAGTTNHENPKEKIARGPENYSRVPGNENFGGRREREKKEASKKIGGHPTIVWTAAFFPLFLFPRLFPSPPILSSHIPIIPGHPFNDLFFFYSKWLTKFTMVPSASIWVCPLALNVNCALCHRPLPPVTDSRQIASTRWRFRCWFQIMSKKHSAQWTMQCYFNKPRR